MRLVCTGSLPHNPIPTCPQGLRHSFTLARDSFRNQSSWQILFYKICNWCFFLMHFISTNCKHFSGICSLFLFTVKTCGFLLMLMLWSEADEDVHWHLLSFASVAVQYWARREERREALSPCQEISFDQDFRTKGWPWISFTGLRTRWHRTLARAEIVPVKCQYTQPWQIRLLLLSVLGDQASGQRIASNLQR